MRQPAVWQGGDGEESPWLGELGLQGRRGHGQSSCGSCRLAAPQNRDRWLEGRNEGLRVAPDYALSNSSFCFQLLASLNITKFKAEKQQKFLQHSPHPLWVLNTFPSLEEQFRPAAFLNKSRKTAGARRHGGRTPAR